MGTIPTPPTFVAGAVLVAADLNMLRDVQNFLLSVPRCYAYDSVGQACTSAAWKTIALNAEVFDNVQSGDSPGHDTVTNNSRIYFRTSGKFEIVAQCTFQANSTGSRATQIRLNAAGNVASGTQLIFTSQDPLASVVTSVPVPSIEVTVTAGDYIEMFGFQDSGISLNTWPAQSYTFLRTKLVGV